MYLAKDNEQIPRHPETIAAGKKAGCLQIDRYPKDNPNLDDIARWWRKLNLYLEERGPTSMDVTQHMHYASRPETVAQAWKKIKASILAEVGLAKLNLP